MGVVEEIQELIAGVKHRLHQLAQEHRKRGWEYDAMLAGIAAILDSKTHGQIDTMRQEGATSLSVVGEKDRDLEYFRECIARSEACEAAGDCVLGVFIEVPDAMRDELSAGVVYEMLRNEFDWWKEKGMAREATEDEKRHDRQAESFRANLARVRLAARLAA
jgi:hypothetical protein